MWLCCTHEGSRSVIGSGTCMPLCSRATGTCVWKQRPHSTVCQPPCRRHSLWHFLPTCRTCNTRGHHNGHSHVHSLFHSHGRSNLWSAGQSWDLHCTEHTKGDAAAGGPHPQRVTCPRQIYSLCGPAHVNPWCGGVRPFCDWKIHSYAAAVKLHAIGSLLCLRAEAQLSASKPTGATRFSAAPQAHQPLWHPLCSQSRQKQSRATSGTADRTQWWHPTGDHIWRRPPSGPAPWCKGWDQTPQGSS